MDLPSTKPYLIRAIHEWCTDHGFTPYLAVAVDSRTLVPREHVRDGQIVLNIGLEATAHLRMSNETITFQARFGGVARDIAIPIGCVAAIYARENGGGMAFEPEIGEDQPAVSREGAPQAAGSGPSEERETSPRPPPAGRPRLQRVK